MENVAVCSSENHQPPNEEQESIYPESDQIEPELAKILYEKHCAILILEHLPVGSVFGIDLTSYRTGEKFKGVKLIPPGVHFVYVGALEKNGNQISPKCGFFYDFKPKEILIKRWSIQDEDFDDSHNPHEEERERFQTNLKDLDRYLGAYRYSTYKVYRGLTNKLSGDMIEYLMPDCNRIRAVPYLTRDDATTSTKQASVDRKKVRPRFSDGDTKPTEENLLPDLKPHQSTVIHFTKIPRDHVDSAQPIDPKLITQYNLDSTTKLEQAFGAGKQRLLAEFQFAFITLLLCDVYECFEQWKLLLGLVCLADSGLTRFTDIFQQFVEILTNQVDQIPEDFFEDIADANNLLRCQLDIFFQNIEDCPSSSEMIGNLKRSASNLKLLLENKFGWEFKLERDDEQPVVVEL